jgi:multidrug resistance efflux pump
LLLLELRRHDLRGVDEMADVTMTLEEYEALRRLITSERESEGAIEQAKAAPKKRRSKKNPKLKRALTEANRRMRLKSGALRKGKTQADVMRLAHKLMKKM